MSTLTVEDIQRAAQKLKAAAIDFDNFVCVYDGRVFLMKGREVVAWKSLDDKGTGYRKVDPPLRWGEAMKKLVAVVVVVLGLVSPAVAGMKCLPLPGMTAFQVEACLDPVTREFNKRKSEGGDVVEWVTFETRPCWYDSSLAFLKFRNGRLEAMRTEPTFKAPATFSCQDKISKGEFYASK